MAIVERLTLGPQDHGRQIAYDEFLASDTVEGYTIREYWVIDGLQDADHPMCASIGGLPGVGA